MERNIILVGGPPGSGKSKLSANLAKMYEGEITAEHISSGDTIRHIGRGAIQSDHFERVIQHLNSPCANAPLEDEVMYDVVSEAISRQTTADLIILDGYPRYESQVCDSLVVAESNNYTIAGLLITQADDAELLKRLLKRKQRDFASPINETRARQRIDHHKQTFSGAAMELYYKGVRFSQIDTMGTPTETAAHAYLASKFFLSTTQSPKDTL